MAHFSTILLKGRQHPLAREQRLDNRLELDEAVLSVRLINYAGPRLYMSMLLLLSFALLVTLVGAGGPQMCA